MRKTLVPPIKCQGIKTKLVPLILANARLHETGAWIEPFMGSGVVGMNVQPNLALFADVNPHLIAFYNALDSGTITPGSALTYLKEEGRLLLQNGEGHYYTVRERFNREGNPLDFLFLSRSCFNGMIRFNRHGGFNVPFCKKPHRFSQAYITKIVNQISRFCELLQGSNWVFRCQDFGVSIDSATESDLIYCDPPYLGRHVDYFNSWSEDDEERLFHCLLKTKARFILSTWHSNKYRENDCLQKFWSKFHIVTQEHFYHVGAKEDNRNSMLEALVMNFTPACHGIEKKKLTQPSLFDALEQHVDH